MIVLGFVLNLIGGDWEEENVIVARAIRVFSGTNVAVALVVVPVIIVPGTCSIFVVIWTAYMEAVVVSRALSKVALLRGGDAVSV